MNEIIELKAKLSKMKSELPQMGAMIGWVNDLIKDVEHIETLVQDMLK